MMIKQQNINIVSNIALVPDKIFLMELKSAYLAREAKPGQFVEVKCSKTFDPLLPRPFSIHDVENGMIKILYQVVGRGTKLLSQKKVGDKVNVLGPLGNGFSIDVKMAKALLFAGGMGAAPLYFLARKLVEKNKDVELYFGAKSSKNLLTINQFKKLGIKIHVATEDGSCGKKGLITCLDVRAIHESPLLYTCGPWPMMKEIAKWALKHNLTGQVSLEKEMACGVGVCLGCVVKIRGEYKRVCKDGPVFAMNEVD
ncbi:MAG: dihydroorotate dehydrogenase electron transfer subunit [bacterium]